jgi:riboflavin synthase
MLDHLFQICEPITSAGIKELQMFTGIIQTVGTVGAIERVETGARLAIDTGHWEPAMGYEPILGDSIAVSGVCLTITAMSPSRLTFDVITETLNRTILGDLQVGNKVHLEPALLATQPLGGHFVQGHVDGVGTITAVQRDASDFRLTITPPKELMAYVIPKGGIAIDGVSLTIAAVHDDSFEVALIPTTLDEHYTTFASATVGRAVNLEADVLTKTTITFLQRQQAGAPAG